MVKEVVGCSGDGHLGGRAAPDAAVQEQPGQALRGFGEEGKSDGERDRADEATAAHSGLILIGQSLAASSAEGGRTDCRIYLRD